MHYEPARQIKPVDVTRREREEIYECYLKPTSWSKEPQQGKENNNDSDADRKSAMSMPMTQLNFGQRDKGQAEPLEEDTVLPFMPIRTIERQ